MKSYTQYLPMFVAQDYDFVNITSLIEKAVAASGIKEGLCLVNPMHVSASVFVHYGGEPLQQEMQGWVDWMNFLEPPEQPAELFFQPPPQQEALDPEIRRRLLGREVVLAITAGRLELGDSEQVFYGEFDGGREKKVLIKVIGE
jgi:secondary thiamine-phosphate synthase enzyme